MTQFEDLELDALLQQAARDEVLSNEQALALAGVEDTARLAGVAATLRDSAHGNIISYSRKVFIPLTRLCRDVCHYCTYAKVPRHIGEPYMSVEIIVPDRIRLHTGGPQGSFAGTPHPDRCWTLRSRRRPCEGLLTGTPFVMIAQLVFDSF